ncbi:E3 ubiquitin-protein ligase TRIM21-like isoform X3 [Dendropsophus ebraccatus]
MDEQDNAQQKEEEKSPSCLVLQEDEKTQVSHRRAYLKEIAWKMFQDYEKKLYTLHFIGDLQREKLKESFHHLHQYLAKEAETCMTKQKDLVETSIKDSEVKVQSLLGFSTSLTNLLVKMENGEMVMTTEQLKTLREYLVEVSKLSVAQTSPLSPFQVQEWRGIRHIVRPVSDSLQFYPNSAHPNLFISKDCKQVRYTSIPQVRCINAYFEPGLYVLGLPGFNCGQHYWEVDVGHKSNWILGIVKESVPRKVPHNISMNSGFWVLRKQDNNVYYGCDLSTLNLATCPMRVGVFVDVSCSHIAFYNADTTGLIFRISECSFTGYLFPFFCPGVPVKEEDLAPLSLC